MIPSLRYTLAFVINVVMPAAAYRLALPHYGLLGALVASAIPLLAWVCIDLICSRHFDALSAMVLAAIAMSLLILVSEPSQWLRAVREPLVSGIIGAFFLLSLFARRPLVFYIARSTLARERTGRALEFDTMWQVRPALVKSIRLMTAVWGVGLVSENAGRLWVTYSMDADEAYRLSAFARYGTYAGLMGWSIFYRHRYIKRQ
jgi:hypothetical protein